MIMRGARAGGLRESESILFEMGKPQYLQPDTTAGAEEERQISQENKIIFFKKPPNKRTNYNKFKITSALQWRWNFLLQEWNAEHSPVDNFVVLRDLELLRTIDVSLNSQYFFSLQFMIYIFIGHTAKQGTYPPKFTS